MTPHPVPDPRDPASELVRGIVEFAAARNWSVFSDDVLDVLWLAATDSGGDLFRTRREEGPAIQPPVTRKGPALPSESKDTQQSQPPPVQPPAQMFDVHPRTRTSPADHVVRLPAPRALPNERVLLQALRPILGRGPSRIRRQLDLDATIRRFVDEHVWEFVERPVNERQVELMLILDHSPSMDMWRSVLRELRRTLKSCGAFRRVDVAYLVSRDGVPCLVKSPGEKTNRTSSARPQPLNSAGPRLCLVATDCVSRTWRLAPWIDLVDKWSHGASVALLQVLPEYQWPRTTLAHVDRHCASARHWLTPNRQFRIDASGVDELERLLESAGETTEQEARSKQRRETYGKCLLPVASLFETESVRVLSRFLAARGGAWATCYQLSRPANAPPIARKDPLEALNVFRMRASQSARRLATLLAASPAISLPLTRIVQQTHMPGEGGPLVEAELWLGSLLEPIEESESDDPEEVLYTFRAGIREQLLDGVPTRLSHQILERTSRYIEENLGRLGGFRALLSNPQEHRGQFAAGPGSDPVARVAAQILRRQPTELADIVALPARTTGGTSDAGTHPRSPLFSGNRPCSRFAWSPDGDLLAIPLLSGDLCLAGLAVGEVPRVRVSSAGLNQAAWSPDGSVLAIACYHRVVRLFDRKLGKQGELSGHASDVTTVGFSPDGALLASGTAGGTLRLWDCSKWLIIAKLNLDHGDVRSLCWLDESHMAVGCADRTLILRFRRGSLQTAAELDIGATSLALMAPQQRSWLSEARILALGKSNGEIRFWNLDTGQWLSGIFAHGERITALSVSDDGTLLASKSRDGTVVVVSTSNGQIASRLTTPPTSGPYGCVAFQPGTHVLAVAESADTEIALYDLSSLVSRNPDGQGSLRVRILGSLPSESTQEAAFRNACRHIGEELARRGHVLVISSANEETADYHAFLGYVAAEKPGRVVFARPDDRRAGHYAARLEQQIPWRHAPVDKAALRVIAGALTKVFDQDEFVQMLMFRLDLDLSSIPSWKESPLDVLVLSALDLADQTGRLQQMINAACAAKPVDVRLKEVRSRYFHPVVTLDRQFAHERQWSEAVEQEILKSCDAAILVGGNARTRTAWKVAADMIPVVPVPSFAGTAGAVWYESAKKLRAAGVARARLDLLDSQWNRAHAAVVVEIVEQAVPRPGRPDFDNPEFTEEAPEGCNHILWVDDRPNNNTFERREFESAGLRFTLALSTGEALTALRQFRFAAIISDMGRREGQREGYVLLDAIRRDGDQTPLIFYAGSNSVEHKEETRSRGGQGCTNTMEELSQLVGEIVFSRYHDGLGRAPDSPPPSDMQGLNHFLDQIRGRNISELCSITVSPLLQVDSSVPINDQALQFGPWVTSRVQHTLSPTPSFRLGIYPVTNQDFRQFVRSRGYEDRSLWSKGAPVLNFVCRDGKSFGPGTWEHAGTLSRGREHHPVSGVSYYEAEAFCRWLNLLSPQSGWTWRLPTEDMWEYAARLRHAFGPTRYPWGDKFAARRCNCVSEGRGGTSEVGEFAAGNTPDGCADLAGNVWELVDAGDHVETCVLRGGSFVNNEHEVRADLRLWGVLPDQRPHDFGFRCALVGAEPVAK